VERAGDGMELNGIEPSPLASLGRRAPSNFSGGGRTAPPEPPKEVNGSISWWSRGREARERSG
jgi:hypothetical protein